MSVYKEFLVPDNIENRLMYTDFQRTYALNMEGINKLAFELFYDIDAGMLLTGQKPSDYISSVIAFPFEIGVPNTEKYLVMGWSGGALSPADKLVCRETHSYAVNFNLGEYYVDRKYNDFRDFSGYQKIQVWLPYYGFVDINPDDCVGKWLQFRLSVDITTGIGVYYIGTTENRIYNYEPVYPAWTNSSVIDEKTVLLTSVQCNIGKVIPVNANNFSETVRNYLVSGLQIAGTAIIGSMGLPPISLQTTTTTTEKGQVETVHYDRTKGGKGGGWSMKPTSKDVTYYEPTNTERTSVRIYDDDKNSEVASSVFKAGLEAINSIAPSGRPLGSGNASLNGVGSNAVAVVRYYPNYIEQDESEKQRFAHTFGKPCGKFARLKNLEGGYTELSGFHLEGSGFKYATASELAEIKNVLSTGFLLPLANEVPT